MAQKKKAALDAGHFKKLRAAVAAYSDARREVVKQSSDALARAKQAIFALHRDDLKEAARLLNESEAVLKSIAKRFGKLAGIEYEGSYRVAVEEYIEARLLEAFIRGERIGNVAAPGADEDSYLGGLLDFTGELVRRAITVATRGEFDEVKRCHQMLTEVMGEIIPMNITGPLRQKFDQAKVNTRKMEEIAYDIALRRGSRL